MVRNLMKCFGDHLVKLFCGKFGEGTNESASATSGIGAQCVTLAARVEVRPENNNNNKPLQSYGARRPIPLCQDTEDGRSWRHNATSMADPPFLLQLPCHSRSHASA